MTVEEELNVLEEALRRLKIEYDMFFGGGSKKAPEDTEFRVKSMIKKYSDSQRLNFSQRFRYNSIAQRYALFSDLWRQKMKIKEEGYRRLQDAVLGIAGMRREEEVAAAQAMEESPRARSRPSPSGCTAPTWRRSTTTCRNCSTPCWMPRSRPATPADPGGTLIRSRPS